jgi:hypothetical protein
MKAQSQLLMALAAGLLGAATAAVAADQVGTPDQVGSAAPSQAYVMMAGHWDSVNGQWKWVAPHWELPPARDAVYVAGHWAAENGKWVWVNGAWNVGQTPAAQAGPPQPPGADGQVAGAGSGVAMPSTPPPYVNGQDGPGGVDRSYDPGVVSTTDYGPIDYSATYPYYYDYPAYWAGDPWFWGGGFIGLGYYGGGYWRGGRWYGGGYGRGGYAHGGYGHGAYGRAGGHAGAAVHGGGGFHR